MSAIEHIEAPIMVVEQPTPLSAIMEAIQSADLSYQDTFNLGMYLLTSVSKHVVPNTKWKPFGTPALKAALLSGAQDAPKKRGRPPKVSKETLDEVKDSGKAAAAAITSGALTEPLVKKPRGRPPMSEEEKAARKAERLAAKALTLAVVENADMEELATELEKDLNISNEAPSEVPVAPEVTSEASVAPKVRKLVKRPTTNA